MLDFIVIVSLMLTIGHFS